ncbi:hypothetical protein CJ030_MR1G012654 [Morella rubra]|uniref:Uncharacterized protein n=1 Tax=Morella rubra TaxID=262757 RepID=A0A6A1WRR2_9ROSI|nr:hypothetical protein CJ030_MR1G012648 [Morella rubra]KAB1227860.1 hypothetical protein CJ030_MR1G012654 [Morella rubra]
MLSNSELYNLLTEKEEVPDHLPNIPHNAVKNFIRMLHLIVAYNIDPRWRTSEVSFKRAKLMVYIVRGVPVDIPSLIFWNIMKEADSFEAKASRSDLLRDVRKNRSQLKQGKGAVDNAAQPAWATELLERFGRLEELVRKKFEWQEDKID